MATAAPGPQTTASFTVHGRRFTLAGLRLYYDGDVVLRIPAGDARAGWASAPGSRLQAVNVYAAETYPVFTGPGGPVERRNYKLCLRGHDYYWMTRGGDLGGGGVSDVPSEDGLVAVKAGTILHDRDWKDVCNRAMDDERW